MMSIYKTCTRCGNTKTIEAFPRHNKTLDGRQSVCKECFKEIGNMGEKKGGRPTNKEIREPLYTRFAPIAEALEAILSDWDYCGAPSLEGVIGTRQLERARNALIAYRMETAPDL